MQRVGDIPRVYERCADTSMGVAPIAARTTHHYASKVPRDGGETDMIARTMLARWLPGTSSTAHQLVRWDMDIAIRAMRNGFAPWGCIVEVYGFEKRLRCRIVDFNGQPILDDFYLSAPDTAEPHGLREAIKLTRARIEQKGFAVQPWEPQW